MLTSRAALELIRSQLRAEVLTRLDPTVDDYAHSVVVAALGALREISLRVVESDQWCEASVIALRAAGRTWPSRLAVVPDYADRVSLLVAAADAAASLGEARGLLLEAAETAIDAIWASPRGAGENALLHEIREILAADTERELAHSGREA